MISILVLIIFFSNDIVEPLFKYLAQFIFDCCRVDIFLRKLADEGYQSNLSERLNGIASAYKLAISSPFGYSKTLLGAGSPLFAFVSCYSGWLGLCFLGAYFYKIMKMYITLCGADGSWFPQHFLMAIVFIALFLSGYGWDRASGILILIIFYKLLYERTSTLKIS